jgi:uncharacterized protein (DUF2236 family)
MWSDGELQVGGEAQEIGSFLVQPPTRAMRPAMAVLVAVAARLLPPPVARMFDVSWRGAALLRLQSIVALAALGATRGLYHLLPRSVRYLTPYLRATNRLSPLSAAVASSTNHVLSILMSPKPSY